MDVNSALNFAVNAIHRYVVSLISMITNNNNFSSWQHEFFHFGLISLRFVSLKRRWRNLFVLYYTTEMMSRALLTTVALETVLICWRVIYIISSISCGLEAVDGWTCARARASLWSFTRDNLLWRCSTKRTIGGSYEYMYEYMYGKRWKENAIAFTHFVTDIASNTTR